MTIDWHMFLPALVLLLMPGDVFNGGKVRYRDIMRDWDGYRLRTLAHGLHVIDLGRAALGTWWLIASLHGAPNPHGLATYEVLLTQGGIRIFAVWIQTVVCREPGAVNAPFAFVTGLLLADFSPITSAFAIALALPIALGTQIPVAFFPVVAIAHLGIGIWFNGRGAVLGFSVGTIAALVPLLWSVTFRRDLVVAHRAKRHVAETYPSRLR